MRPCYATKLPGSSLAVLDGMEYTQPGTWLITRVNTPAPHRGKGVAAELMRQCMADADAEGVTLYLQVSPYLDSPMQHAALRQWYMRLGFGPADPEQPSTGVLCRTPQSVRATPAERATARSSTSAGWAKAWAAARAGEA